MKRILHVVGKMDRAGAETMLMNLYRHIDRSKIQFDFVVYSKEPGDYDNEIIELGGRIIPIIATSNLKRMQILKNFLTKHSEYNIVHSHMLLNSMFSLWAAKTVGIKHRVAHAHSTSNGKVGWVNKIYEKSAIFTINKLATKKIACGHAAANYLFPESSDVLILPNSVELEKLANLREKRKEKKEISDSGDVLKILQVGRITPVKNPFFTLKIAKEIKNLGLPGHIYFLGQGSLEKELQLEIDKAHLDDQVSLRGLSNEVPELMAEADILIMPSLHEGFPVVLVESQAVGLPAVVSTGVSKEVDLGVGLVSFLSTSSSISEWINAIFGERNKNAFDYYTRVKTLKQKGFDVIENARKLQDFYGQMS